MNSIVPAANYTFDASEKTITLSNPYNSMTEEQIVTIRNITKNQLIYDSANTNRGQISITNGTTSVNIRHGFHKTPSSIQITPTSSLGTASSIWVSSKDTGTGNLFTVSTNVDPGQDVTFDWQATL